MRASDSFERTPSPRPERECNNVFHDGIQTCGCKGGQGRSAHDIANEGFAILMIAAAFAVGAFVGAVAAVLIR